MCVYVKDDGTKCLKSTDRDLKIANFGSVICVKRKSVYHGGVPKCVVPDGVAIFRKKDNYEKVLTNMLKYTSLGARTKLCRQKMHVKTK